MVIYVIIVKIGGNVIKKNLDNIIYDISELARNQNVILVHGGGNIVTEVSKKLNIEPKFVVSPSGIRSRYTDEKELEVYIMVMVGKINKLIVSKLYALNVKSIGISGADGPTLIAERKKRIIIVDQRGRKRVIDGGYTGKIKKVNTELINNLLALGYVIVIAPIAIDTDGTLLNVDGDQAACMLASALKVNTLIILTDVEGVITNGHVLKTIKLNEIPNILPKIGPGMNRKLLMIKKAIENGVNKVIIASGLKSEPIKHALEGDGTSIIGE